MVDLLKFISSKKILSNVVVLAITKFIVKIYPKFNYARPKKIWVRFTSGIFLTGISFFFNEKLQYHS